MPNIVAMESKQLSKWYDTRYVIVNQTTGDVLDDAQGYGFRSKEKAYAAYRYKHPELAFNS